MIANVLVIGVGLVLSGWVLLEALWWTVCRVRSRINAAWWDVQYADPADHHAALVLAQAVPGVIHAEVVYSTRNGPDRQRHGH